MSNTMQKNSYVLGTGLGELERLGLQHRIWRRTVLDAFQRWGVKSDKTVLDVGAGPGYVTMDLADIVGKNGKVYALERADNYYEALTQKLAQANYNHVFVSHQDVLNDWPKMDPVDFSWCRWLLCFVSDPEKVIQNIHSKVKPGGISIFHEYIDYDTWKMFPACPEHTEFIDHTIKSWIDSGGEPDIGARLPQLLTQNGYEILDFRPHTFIVDNTDYMWEWPMSFIDVNIRHQMDIGAIDKATGERWLQAMNTAVQQNPCHFLTPTVGEIVARKL